MMTVREVNETFTEKGLHIVLPLPDDWLVKNLEILEKKHLPGGVAALLNVTYVNDRGEETSELFQCDTKVDHPSRKQVRDSSSDVHLKEHFLPVRETSAFQSETEAGGYLQEAFSHFLLDKEYSPVEQSGMADICFQRGEQIFFLNISIRCDSVAYEKARHLIELRHEYGSEHDYGLVVPAFQDSLGVSLIQQERWISKNEEYFSTHHIGVYAVDNLNPNQIYAFTTYPKTKDFRRYFMITSGQWTSVRDRYVASRGAKGSL